MQKSFVFLIRCFLPNDPAMIESVGCHYPRGDMAWRENEVLLLLVHEPDVPQMDIQILLLNYAKLQINEDSPLTDWLHAIAPHMFCQCLSL